MFKLSYTSVPVKCNIKLTLLIKSWISRLCSSKYAKALSFHSDSILLVKFLHYHNFLPINYSFLALMVDPFQKEPKTHTFELFLCRFRARVQVAIKAFYCIGLCIINPLNIQILLIKYAIKLYLSIQVAVKFQHSIIFCPLIILFWHLWFILFRKSQRPKVVPLHIYRLSCSLWISRFRTRVISVANYSLMVSFSKAKGPF